MITPYLTEPTLAQNDPVLQNIAHKFFRPQLGHYHVGDRVFQNKVQALLACAENETPEWRFLEEDLTQVDWKQEPKQDLYKLYRQRAWQLRDTYDYLVLMYSGGVDSYAVLRTFVDNNIPLDGIVTYGSFKFNNWQGMTRNAEAYNVALPVIKKLRNKHGKPINHYMLDDWPLFDNFWDESWVLSTGNGQLSPEAYVFNFHWQDPFIQNFLSKGNTAFIRGVDKPRIIRQGNEWKYIFIDSTTTGAFPSGFDPKTNHYYASEYFYWQADLPEILIKQAHQVRNGMRGYMKNSKHPREYWDNILSIEKDKFVQTEYLKWVDPLIYGQYVDQKPGQERPYFTLGKSPNALAWHKDHAFFEHGKLENIEIWKKGLQYCIDNIDRRFFNNVSDCPNENFNQFKKYGFKGICSKAYTFAVDLED
jgi:hypothetical protein